MRKRNPFRLLFLNMTAICVVVLSIMYTCANYASLRKQYQKENQEKMQMVVNDFQRQMERFEEIRLRVMTNKLYQPFYFQKQKYYEILLLEDFEQYRFSSTLTEDCFLYYGDEWVFHSTGRIQYLNYYFRGLLPGEQKSLIDALQNPENIVFFPASEEVFILLPIKAVANKDEKNTATLGFVVENENLADRFRDVAGNLEGEISLYANDILLFSDSGKSCTPESGKVITAHSSNGLFTICYRPEGRITQVKTLVFPSLIILLVNIIVLFNIANIMARKQYQPVLDISNKYQMSIAESGKQEFDNALEEINSMIENLIRSNSVASQSIEQKQDMLRKQVYRMLLFGQYTTGIETYLEQLQINLPGPYFYVISLSFEQEDCTEATFADFQEKLEQGTETMENCYTYAYHYTEKKQILVICSVPGKEEERVLTEYVCELAGGLEERVVVGEGNIYQSLSRLHASWAESMEDIQRKNTVEQPDTSKTFVYNPQELHQLCASLVKGDEEDTFERFHTYMQKMENREMSFLMQQCIFAEFVSELTKLAYKYHIEVSSQSVSMIVTSKNVKEFKEAAENLLLQLEKEFQQLKQQEDRNKENEICNYINEHFMEYEISIEKVAEELNVSVPAVRQAVLECTGKTYKEYIISCRIQYAENLLVNTDLSIAEVCRKVGYGNVSHFIKLFKETTGVTPAKYVSVYGFRDL